MPPVVTRFLSYILSAMPEKKLFSKFCIYICLRTVVAVITNSNSQIEGSRSFMKIVFKNKVAENSTPHLCSTHFTRRTNRNLTIM